MLALPTRDDDASDDEVSSIVEDGWRAMERNSCAVALERFETALALAERTESEYLSVACYGVGAALSCLKKWRRAIPPLERARNLFRASDHVLGEAASLSTLSLSFWSLYRRQTALKLAAQAYALTWRLECKESLYCIHQLSGFLITSRMWRHAETVSRRMAGLAEALGKTEEEALGWTRAAAAALKRNRCDRAERYLYNAETIIEETTPDARYEYFTIRARYLALTCRRVAIDYLNARNVEDFSGFLLNRIAFQKLRMARSRSDFRRAFEDIRAAINLVAGELP